MVPASDIRNLVKGSRIHGSLYRDPAVFQRELDAIWYKVWVYIGHESEVPNPNDYVMKSIGPEPVIMTRDRQGAIHLLHNRCPHRGNRVCMTEQGNARSFTCPLQSECNGHVRQSRDAGHRSITSRMHHFSTSIPFSAAVPITSFINPHG